MTASVNQLACTAAGNVRVREELIEGNEQLILRTASRVCRRYVSKSDDEWSVALEAFSRAVDVYREDRGDFLPFAQMLIRRALVDHFRTLRHSGSEVPVPPHVLAGEGTPEEDPEGAYLAVVRQSQAAEDRSAREEIEAANELLQGYGFRFYDLAGRAPAQARTKTDCACAVRWLLANPEAMARLKREKKLPIRAITAGSGVSRKTLDRYRNYLIMAALILDGDFPLIARYLNDMKEERI